MRSEVLRESPPQVSEKIEGENSFSLNYDILNSLLGESLDIDSDTLDFGKNHNFREQVQKNQGLQNPHKHVYKRYYGVLNALFSKMAEKPKYMHSKWLFGFKILFGLADNFLAKNENVLLEFDLNVFKKFRDWDKRSNKLNSYIACGFTGKKQISIEGEERKIIYNCNERHTCPRCAERYSYSKAKNFKTVLRGILRTKAHSSVATPVFTIPKELSEFFHSLVPEARRDIRNKLHKSAKQTIERVLGAGVNEGSKLAIATVFHSWSSFKPWEPHYHIHSFLPSVYLKKQSGCFIRAKLSNSGFVKKSCLGKLKKVWKQRLQENLHGYLPEGYEFSKMSNPDYKFIKFEDEGKLAHRVNYALRSQLVDIWKSVYKNKFPKGQAPKFLKKYKRFPVDRIPEIGQIYETFRYRGERIRYYGYWSKGVRVRYLCPFFGLRLIHQEPDNFQVIEEHGFVVVGRSKDYLWIHYTAPSINDQKVDRWGFKGENSCETGQVWEFYPKRSPPKSKNLLN